MADKGRSTDAAPDAEEQGTTALSEPVTASAPSDLRPRRVEFYMRDGKHGYRRVADTGEIVQELPPTHNTLDDAVDAAKEDGTNDGLAIVL